MAVIQGASIQQVAPDNFLHPVAALRRYLDEIGNVVSNAQFGTGRVKTVDSTKQPCPEEQADCDYYQSLEDQAFQPDNTPDPGFVQPPYGAGPKFLSGVAGDR